MYYPFAMHLVGMKMRVPLAPSGVLCALFHARMHKIEARASFVHRNPAVVGQGAPPCLALHGSAVLWGGEVSRPPVPSVSFRGILVLE